MTAWIFDFILIFLVIYGILYFLRGTRSANVLVGITVLLIISSELTGVLGLKVVSFLLNQLWTFLGIAIIVIFQPEIRRFFAQTGSLLTNIPFMRTRQTHMDRTIDETVNAVMQMSESRTGALVVFKRNIGLKNIVKHSTELDCKVDSLLLQTIFFKNSPLHDCAVIIQDDRIVAAKAVLPLTPEDELNPAMKYGTRHRAALGLAEETDAVVVVVSEETGTVSIAYRGELQRGFTSDQLRKRLRELLMERETADGKREEAGEIPEKMFAPDAESDEKEQDHEYK